MNTVKCSNRLCEKEYSVKFNKCPFCGEDNPQFKRKKQSVIGREANIINYNRLLIIIISCGVAFVVLILSSLIITALGWEKSIGAKGLIAGTAIAVGSYCESYLKGKILIGNKNKKQFNKNNKPQKKKRPYKVILVISLLMVSTVVLLIIFSLSNRTKKDFENAKQKNTVEAYIEFVNKYPDTEFSDEARDSVVNIYQKQYEILEIPVLRNGLDAQLKDKLREMREKRIDKVYQEAKEINTIEGWEKYISIVPYGSQRDAQQMINLLKEEQTWGTENSAWQTALKMNNILSFEKYLSLFPHGQHSKQAETRIIDLEVDNVFTNEHSTLPTMNKLYSMGTSYSIIELENRTEYVLTVSYSGPDSKRIIIHPHKTEKVHIGNGYYRIAASVGHGIRPFAGTENLDGSHYSVYYYIVTNRSYGY